MSYSGSVLSLPSSLSWIKPTYAHLLPKRSHKRLCRDDEDSGVEEEEELYMKKRVDDGGEQQVKLFNSSSSSSSDSLREEFQFTSEEEEDNLMMASMKRRKKKRMMMMVTTMTTTTTTTTGYDSSLFHNNNRHMITTSTSTTTTPVTTHFMMDKCLRWFDSYTCRHNNKNAITFTTQTQTHNNNNNNNNNTFDISPSGSGGGGLQQFLLDCGIFDLFNFRYYLLMFQLNVATRMEITRSEWMFGMFQMQVDSIDKLRHQLSIWEQETGSWSLEKAKTFISFVFNLLRDRSDGRSVETKLAAKALYCIMINRSPFTVSFCQFLDTQTKYRVLTMDQFKIFIDWSLIVRPDFSNYDCQDAWPSIYDDYVEYVRMNITNIRHYRE